MKIAYRLFVLLLISAFLFGCSEKKVGIEGKLLDGRGQPLSGVTVVFKQVQATKGYEQFETKTLSTGVFRIDGVMAASEYIITPVSDKWKTKVTTTITTLSEGQTMVLSNPIVVRFNAMKDGTVIDTKTGLQWLISGVTDLNSSNVLSAVKNMKDSGFTDWRLPTKEEVAQLQGAPTAPVTQPETGLSQKTCCVWVAEPNSESVEWKFYVDDGNDVWASSKVAPDDRIVAVRNYIPSDATTAAPAAKAPVPPVTPAAETPAAVTPAPPVAAPSAKPTAEKKPAAERPAKLITKKDIPAVVLPEPAPAPVIEKQDIPSVKSDDGVLRASRKTCLANKGQPVKPRATAAPSVAARPVAAPSDEDSPAKQAPSVKSRPTAVAPEVADAPAKQSPSTRVRTTSQRDRSGNSVTIHFAMNKSAISPEELTKLKSFYAKIKDKQGRIVIEGNSDADGDAADNFRISGERALSAKTMLNKLDLNKTFDVKVAGLSDIKPIADSSTEAGRSLNRRAEITFIPESPDTTASSPSMPPPAKTKSRAEAAPEVAAPVKQAPVEKVTIPAVIKTEEGGILRASRKACIAKKGQPAK